MYKKRQLTNKKEGY